MRTLNPRAALNRFVDGLLGRRGVKVALFIATPYAVIVTIAMVWYFFAEFVPNCM